MSTRLGRGILQSLRARVDADVGDLIRENKGLRQARYGWMRRLLRNWLVGKPAAALAWTYSVAICGLFLIEWLAHHWLPCVYQGVTETDFAKDAAGFFLTAQIGVLAVLTVAIGVVTLLTQKDDGSAVNTDVRLYYFESFSYEIATSGVLLSCVLVAQLFWPLQPAISFLVGDDVVEHFKVCVTGLHALWLIFNLYLFLHFINTTLRFVEPMSRAKLRKQYSANEIIPRDVRRRLLAVYFGNAPTQMLGETELRNGPLVSFSLGLISAENPVVEVSRRFRTASQLADVWLLPVGWALRRWQRRTRSQGQPQNQFGQVHWSGDLAVMTDFKRVHDGPADIVMREGGVPLTRLERSLLKIGFRFGKVDQREEDLPTPTDFIEQLISKLVNQIDAGAPNGFDDVLKETVDFHSFALEAQNTRDENGMLVNLAQVSDGLFRQPDFEWIREYRRAYAAAVNSMSSDVYFAQGMSGLVVRLWPADPAAFPASVLTNILDLGRIQVSIFEAWVTRRAVVAPPEVGAATDLAGSDLRSYEDALTQFVSSWETLQQLIISSFEIRRVPRSGDESYWQSASACWPSLQTHMRNAAYFLAAAVWNEDLLGNDRFRDLLVRWVQAFYAQLQNIFPFRDALMLTPDLLKKTWPESQAAATRTLMFPRGPLRATTVFGVLLLETHLDAIAITGAVLLHWFATRQQPSPATAQTAVLTLRREPLPGSGSTLLDHTTTQKPIFRLVFDLLVREALHSPFEESTYSGYLDAQIRILNEMAAPRMIPGRIYGGFTLDGFQRLTPEFLAIMASNLPTEGDGGVADLMQRLLIDQPEFQVDRTLRDFAYTFGRYADALAGEADERFATTVGCFIGDPDLGALRARLKAILDGVVSAIKVRRLQRVREAPLDQARLKAVRDAVESALLANNQPFGAFPQVVVARTDQRPEVRDTVWRSMDRGSFTQPEMSGVTFGELPSIFVEVATNFLRNIGWWELNRRPKVIEELRSEIGVVEFMALAIEAAQNEELGDDLMLMVPHDPIGNAVSMTASGFPTDGLSADLVTHEPNVQSGIGCRYAGTVEGLPVFIGPYRDVAVLCSRSLLRAIRFGNVRDVEAIYDFELFDQGDPEESEVRIWLAPQLEWEEQEHVEFRFVSASEIPVDEGSKDDLTD